jgi:hypothetical protein
MVSNSLCVKPLLPLVNGNKVFQSLNDGLACQFEGMSVPMVIAGVVYLHPHFRNTSSYRILLNEG